MFFLHSQRKYQHLMRTLTKVRSRHHRHHICVRREDGKQRLGWANLLKEMSKMPVIFIVVFDTCFNILET